MSVAWQAQDKRHVHQRCEEVRALISCEELRFGADRQFWEDDFGDRCSIFVASTVL